MGLLQRSVTPVVTIEHVVGMEEGSTFMVVILDHTGQVTDEIAQLAHSINHMSEGAIT
ncbi:hypothetical protein [Ammoniphilus sp. CFH 90114]|uniref:HAMP domain-containing protein n=1 Tax=Ammoniphilus sp. CFH 90114 TaxID=2493665 RepID=UPI0013E92288|nr:hypothetical protein [Ammoniphilus sp. CFH 90114]